MGLIKWLFGSRVVPVEPPHNSKADTIGIRESDLAPGTWEVYARDGDEIMVLAVCDSQEAARGHQRLYLRYAGDAPVV